MLDIIYRPGTKNDLYYLKNDDEDERIVKSLFSFRLKKKKRKSKNSKIFRGDRAFSTFGQNSQSRHLLRNYKYVPRRSIL